MQNSVLPTTETRLRPAREVSKILPFTIRRVCSGHTFLIKLEKIFFKVRAVVITSQKYVEAIIDDCEAGLLNLESCKGAAQWPCVSRYDRSGDDAGGTFRLSRISYFVAL